MSLTLNWPVAGSFTDSPMVEVNNDTVKTLKQ